MSLVAAIVGGHRLNSVVILLDHAVTNIMDWPMTAIALLYDATSQPFKVLENEARGSQNTSARLSQHRNRKLISSIAKLAPLEHVSNYGGKTIIIIYYEDKYFNANITSCCGEMAPPESTHYTRLLYGDVDRLGKLWDVG